MKQAITLLLMVAIMVPKTLGRGSGAPKAACETMKPGHTMTEKQPEESNPYDIIVDVSEYRPGTQVAVTITGGDFIGILLQARKADGTDTTPIGTFTEVPANTKTMECTAADDSFTHANTEIKNEITVKWTSPSESHGNVRFYATIAQTKSIYWMHLGSQKLTVQEDSITTDSPSTSTSSSITTDAPSNNSTDSPSNPTQGPTKKPSSAGPIEKSALMLTLLIPVFGALLVKVFKY